MCDNDSSRDAEYLAGLRSLMDGSSFAAEAGCWRAGWISEADVSTHCTVGVNERGRETGLVLKGANIGAILVPYHHTAPTFRAETGLSALLSDVGLLE